MSMPLLEVLDETLVSTGYWLGCFLAEDSLLILLEDLHF